MTATAWYILKSQNPLARWFNVLHWPFSLWHLSYVVMGAALAVDLDWALLGWTLLAFFLGMGVAAHCADLLNGDPLKLGLRRRHLEVVAVASVLAAVGIGVWQVWAGNAPQAVALAIPVGALLSIGYGKEWPGLHGDWQFAAWWAVFPLLVGGFAQGVTFHPALVPQVVFAFATAYAQRVLSTRSRFLRRQVGIAEAKMFKPREDALIHLHSIEGKDWLLAPLDGALWWMTVMMVSLAAGLLARNVWG